ncbi:SGNH/GDSL hydrolase family protein [Micromonospora polyrhachis]|uniref:Lysophospholipase L1-like esterase n=1 Tax=Micromonospora polyrhachis TaxID=1282883 RepID=A0A7W7WMX3_9ACTN|nr:SGNH/GDSL hydrolase family protein [Micromonospora polyrhachis]MBB4957260.1 lysophospholipase L1-like esterase [Micromonospora polyrhachis]
MAVQKRSLLVAGTAAALAVSLFPPAAAGAAQPVRQTAQTDQTGRPVHPDWRAAWTASMHHPFAGFGTPNWSPAGFADQTLRQVVRVGVGGSSTRVRLSNRFGDRPIRVTGATVGRAGVGAAVQPGSLRPLTFHRSASVTIPAGAEIVSDAASLSTRALDSLAVTLYFADATGPATLHENANATAYRASGDRRSVTGAGAFDQTSQSWYFLTGVETTGRPARDNGVVVAFGDSITDGYGTTPDADNRYPDELAERLSTGRRPLSVVNAGIGGNKLLADSTCFGAAGVSRFDRDVLDQPGVRAVVVLAGVNDIIGGGYPDFGCGSSGVVSAEQLIDGHRRLIRTARARGVRIVGATMLPIKGGVGDDTPTNEDGVPGREAVRDAVNQWIRTSGEYDAVADLDRALADPEDRDALRPAYDSGDHLHPNDAGAAAIAAIVAPLVGGNGPCPDRSESLRG